MLNWKPAFSVFQGGTQQVKALIGKRVRVKQNLYSAAIYDSIHKKHNTTDLKKGAIGVIANPCSR